MGRLSDFATAFSRSPLSPLPGGRPHWRFLAKRRALGYRPKCGGNQGAGTWCVRLLLPGLGTMRQTMLGNADDSRLVAEHQALLVLHKDRGHEHLHP